MVLNLSDAINWQLVARENDLNRPSVDAPWRRSWTVQHPVIQIGIIPNKSTWKWGGSVTQYGLSSPSSTTEFVSAIALKRFSIRTGNLQLVELAGVNPRPWLLEFVFPRWFDLLPTIEIWQYLDS